MRKLVGVAGFEPATPSSRTRCATSHTPISLVRPHYALRQPLRRSRLTMIDRFFFHDFRRQKPASAGSNGVPAMLRVWAGIKLSSRRVSPMSQSGGNRRVLFDQLALLQFRPELRRDLDLHGAVVSDDLLLAGGADNQGRGDIRRCGKLQGRRPEIDARAVLLPRAAFRAFR
jgi:hypothetical protein